MILEIYLFLFFVNLARFYVYVTCLCMLHVFACCMFLHIIVRFHCMFLRVFACHYVLFISSRVKVRVRQDDFSRKRPRRVPSKKALPLKTVLNKTVIKDCHQTSPKVLLK